MRVKIALALALLIALTGIVVLLTRVEDAERRAQAVDQAARIVDRDARAMATWARTLNDSLGRALALEPPPAALALADSVRFALTARLAQASALYWRGEAQRARSAQFMLLTSGEIAQLQLAGLPDPPQRLREDLMRHPELIPFEGTLGGRMRFDPGGIALLSPEWVYARFEDGHTGGSCLLAFDVLRDGRISWRRLAARAD
ncbi:MAG: hypothetical protein A2W00_14245 [Candidatus Eisenbacteria bacterium RBG_16_71_46]|nr:MAG: hypothetical protein A2W00_14245 [Candidatus Eisenbacteria bacterium RBG_16_71_46]